MTDGSSAAGIDGLYYRDNALYGVQNAVEPQRFVRIDLAWEQTRRTTHVLAAVDNRMPLPTTGAMIGKDWWLVADAQFFKLKDGKLKPGETIAPTRIMRLPL